MLACVDVDYREETAVAACVLFRSWSDADSAGERVQSIARVEPYEPGQFYRRELPCLLSVLQSVAEPLETVVVDGYVWLADERKPGLGAHLYEALGRKVPIIGVAKTRFADASAEAVQRGDSRRPLYVSAAGMDRVTAARQIQIMHGAYRIPTLLRKVDQLCRQKRNVGGVIS
ncbi:MAG TPA: endonuclease V [Gemmataceae bacterium]|nr:endonuclease V [Gemmataceae bacterium]